MKNRTLFFIILLLVATHSYVKSEIITGIGTYTTTSLVEGTIGNEIQIPVSATVTITTNVGAYAMIINYDPAILSATSVTRDASVLSGGSWGFNVSTPGQVNVQWAFGNKNVLGAVPMFKIFFRKVSAGSSAISFQVNDCAYGDHSGNVINNCSYVNGNITFQTDAPITRLPILTSCPSAISIPVIVNNFNTIGAISIAMYYDPAVLTYVDYEGNPGIDYLDVNGYSNLGRIGIGGLCFSGLTLPPGETLLTLNFIYHGGYTDLTWESDLETACEYSNADMTPTALLDSPFGNYYINGSVGPNPTTWIGVTNTDWTTLSNWSCDVPTPYTDVIIASAPRYPVISAAGASVKNLTINAGSVTINPEATLTVGTSITNTVGVSGLVIKSDAGNTGSLITSSAVNATVEHYLPGYLWNLITTPVSNQSVADLIENNPFATNGPKYGLAPYDNSIPNWVPYTTSTYPTAGNLDVSKGYEAMLSSSSALTFKGTLVTSNQSIPISNGLNDWNLIGNPFSSAINAANLSNNFLTANSSIFKSGFVSLYVWDAASSTYSVVNNLSGPKYIPVGQSFFINSAPGGGTASFTTAMRTHSTVPFNRNSHGIYPLVDLKAIIDDKNRNTQIYYVPGATEGIDEGYDAGMYNGGNTDNVVYTHINGSEIPFAIQCLPDNDYEGTIITVGLNAAAGTIVTFSTDVSDLPVGLMVFLEDKETGIFTQLDQPGSYYKITLSSACAGIGRFYLHTSQLFISNKKLNENNYSIIPLPQQNKIRIIGNVIPSSETSIFDMSGRQVGSGILTNGSENEISFNPSSNGIYLMKVQNGSSVINKKFNWIY